MDAILHGERFERLPSGRHGLTPEAVAASQRGRMLFAMARAATEKGYPATTVADVVGLAEVSRRTFYEQFPDKLACFLEMYDTGVEVIFGQMRTDVAALPATDWRTRARTTFDTYTRVLADEPDFAWATHVEILSAGPVALDRRAAIIELFADVWRRFHGLARQEDPTLPELPMEAYRTLTAGLEELVRERLRTHGPTSLPELSEVLWRAAVAIFGGGARRQSRRGDI
ncbi:MAG: TetR/AcrR family transcriptional regulator [Acidimicrobiales bacterium]